jgi:hypothetical protein
MDTEQASVHSRLQRPSRVNACLPLSILAICTALPLAPGLTSVPSASKSQSNVLRAVHAFTCGCVLSSHGYMCSGAGSCEAQNRHGEPFEGSIRRIGMGASYSSELH